MDTAIFIALLAYAAVMLWIVHGANSPEDTVLGRIQGGDSGPSIFDGVPDSTVVEFANGEYEATDIYDPEYLKFCVTVRQSAKAVLHHRGVKWQS